MINVGMTIREIVSIASNPSCNGDLYERIIKALELATGNEKLLVACCRVNYDGQFWDQKIPAIKSLRLVTGWGLKEAKDWVESCQHDNKTNFSPPLDPAVAHKLCDELKRCGMDCWTTNA
jgi:ribosomal protein L7/L12